MAVPTTPEMLPNELALFVKKLLVAVLPLIRLARSINVPKFSILPALAFETLDFWLIKYLANLTGGSSLSIFD